MMPGRVFDKAFPQRDGNQFIACRRLRTFMQAWLRPFGRQSIEGDAQQIAGDQPLSFVFRIEIQILGYGDAGHCPLPHGRSWIAASVAASLAAC